MPVAVVVHFGQWKTARFSSQKSHVFLKGITVWFTKISVVGFSLAAFTGFLARAWVLRRRALKARLLNILLYAFLGCPRAAAVRLLPRAYHHEIVWLLSIAAGGAGLPRGTRLRLEPLALIFNGVGFGFSRTP